MTHTSSFAIKDANDFFSEMVLPLYNDFLTNNASSRHALIATIMIYHFYEWVNNEKFTEDHFRKTYLTHEALAEDFDVARQLANGIKHFIAKGVQTTTQRGFSSAFSDAFVKPLNIVYPNGSKVSANMFLRKLVDFWKEQKKAGAF